VPAPEPAVAELGPAPAEEAARHPAQEAAEFL
jgi:hypothetical protein